MLEFGHNRARLVSAAHPDGGLGQKHHGAGTFDGVVARVRGIKDSYERVERFLVTTRGHPAVAAGKLHNGEQQVDTAARCELLDLTRGHLGALVVAAETGGERLNDHAS